VTRSHHDPHSSSFEQTYYCSADLGYGHRVYVNTLSPPGPVSTATLGQRSFLVIARLVLPSAAEEWWPARTVRWVDTQVQIVFEPAGEPVYVWLAGATYAAPSTCRPPWMRLSMSLLASVADGQLEAD